MGLSGHVGHRLQGAEAGPRIRVRSGRERLDAREPVGIDAGGCVRSRVLKL